MSRQPYRNEYSWQKITQIAACYRQASARGERVVVDDVEGLDANEQPAVMRYEDIPMLCEGCHRTSGLWLSGVTDFELRVAPVTSRWAGYENPGIRRRGSSFRCRA